MTANLPTTLALSMLSMAPHSSIVHRIVSEEALQKADLHYLELKQSGELERRRFAEAERIQRLFQDGTRTTL